MFSPFNGSDFSKDSQISITYFLSYVHTLYLDGKLTLLDKLPIIQDEAKTLNWISSQLHLFSAEAISQSMLEHYNNAFKGVTLEKLSTTHAIEKDIIKVSYSLQMRMEIMKSYRRSVIFKGKGENYLSNDLQFGVSTINLSSLFFY